MIGWILGSVYVLVMVWCVWEAWSSPVMPSDLIEGEQKWKQ